MSTNMTPTENLHYAIGELAYAIARADGKVQKEERQKFHGLVVKELDKGNYSFDISDIIFQIMDKDKLSASASYERAFKQIKLNSHYLSPQLKETFIRVMEKVAEAYPPVTVEEKNIIEKFKKDIEPIHGDPIYYGQKV